MTDLKTLSAETKNISPHTDYVSLYSQAGFALFPLAGKKPKIKNFDWRKSVPDFELTAEDFNYGNFGVVIPAHVLVIDVDCKHGAPGKDSYRKLLVDCGLKPGWEADTFVVKTGSGGVHVYLHKDSAISISKTHKDYPGIDFISLGGYVVGAGSIHPETSARYVVALNTPGRMIEAPAILLDKIKKIPLETIADVTPGFVDNDPLNIDRYHEILLNLPGAQAGGLRTSCYVAACRGRDLGLSHEVCQASIIEHYNPKLDPPLSEDEIAGIVRDAYKYATGIQGIKNVASIFQTIQIDSTEDLKNAQYDASPKGVIKPTLNNAVNYLATLPDIAGVFKLNSFTGNIEIDSSVPWYKQRGSNGPNVIDEDVTLLKYHLTRVTKVEFPAAILMEAVIVVAHKRHYHPIRNYLSSRVWDKTPRLDTWLVTYGGAVDTPYTRAIGRKVLCAAVKRVFEPGCKWDYVLIIEGAQGIGKSTACRILGRMWGGDMNLDPHSKDSVAMMQGKWVIELSEMVALKWADANALKSFITREKDTVRPAYARNAKDFHRQSIFIGTVNPEHIGYLHDVTGNRRFWIVNFPGNVNTRQLEDDCDQIWAEVVYRYRNEPLYLNPMEEQLQVIEARARMPEDPLRRHVAQYMKEHPEIEDFDIVDVMGYLSIPATRANKGDQSRIAQALADLGCVKKMVLKDGVWSSVFRKGVKNLKDLQGGR